METIKLENINTKIFWSPAFWKYMQGLDIVWISKILYMSISDNTNLTWENWILEIIEWIKNVTWTQEEFDKIVESEPWMDLDWNMDRLNEHRKNGWTLIWDWYTNDPEDFLIPMPEKYKWKIPYKWSWWEIGWAESYSDITVCFDNFSDKEEYYKTSEVLEVLEKWKEALERWNNPEEKKKMIEEFERK